MQDHSSTFPADRYYRQPSGMTNPYLPKGEITSILIERRNGETHEMLIDTADLPRVLNLPTPIRAHVSGTNELIYARVRINGKTVPFARWLIDCPDDREPDHLNHRTLDNRRGNLRIATRSENMKNRRMGAWKIRKGVWPHARLPRWGAFVWLGEFDDEEEANQVYDDALAVMIREGIIDVELAPPGLQEPKTDTGAGEGDTRAEDAAA